MAGKDRRDSGRNGERGIEFEKIERVVGISANCKEFKNGFSHSLSPDASLHRGFPDNILSVLWMKGSIFLEALIAIFLVSLAFFMVADFIVKSLSIIHLYEEKEVANRTFDTIFYRYVYNVYIPREYNGFGVNVTNEGRTLTIVLTKEGRKYERVYEVLYGEIEGICGDSLHPGDE